MVKFTNEVFMKFDTCCMYCCSGEITKAQPRRMTKSRRMEEIYRSK